ncbi:MAG: hypothetical protein AB8H80_17260 [Planctomycetota bacterium]
MLKGILESSSIFDLPVLATLLFVAIFATVLLRVCQRARQTEYRRMASLPLTDESEVVVLAGSDAAAQAAAAPQNSRGSEGL